MGIKQLNLEMKRLVLASAIVAGSMITTTANAELDTSFNTTLSYGVSWRMEGRDPALVGSLANGGAAAGTDVSDDGNLNFDKGDVFSHIVKGVSELQLEKDNVGAFVRAKYWYDYELENGDQQHGHENNNWTANSELDDSDFNDFAKFKGFEFLDAYVYGGFEAGDKPIELRLGRQVINWGESTFILGMNRVNPIDVSAFRRPGAEIKEGLLPVNMISGNVGLSNALNLEAYYQLEWEKTPIDGCGTYFSDLDFAAEGCDWLSVIEGGPANGFAIARDPSDVEPDDDGQFGISLRYFAESIDTEFGLYYQNLHNRTPVLNVRFNAAGLTAGSVALNAAPAVPPTAIPVYYQVEYPEDTEILGASMATTVGDVSLSGEISVRMDEPVDINGPTILAGGVGTALFETAFGPGAACGAPAALGAFGTRACAAWADYNNTGDGIARGWDRFDIYQAQMTAVNFIDNVMGASRLTLLGEVGVVYVDDLPNQNVMPYGRNPVFGPPVAAGGTNNNGLITETSWGYRALAIWEYPNAIAGVSLSPKLAFSHDVDGVSPGPTFQEDRISASIALNASYLTKYRAGISYTMFDDGEANTIEDRDFISLSFSMDL